MKYSFYLLFFLIPVIFSCKNDKTSEITALESKLAKSGAMDPKLAKELIALYQKEAKSLNNEKSSTLLYRAGQVSSGIKEYPQAIAFWDEVLTKYPKSAEAAGALFAKAFTYENYMGDIEKAKSAYEDYIVKFPENDTLVQQAKICLENLGKSPEEMLKSVLKK